MRKKGIIILSSILLLVSLIIGASQVYRHNNKSMYTNNLSDVEKTVIYNPTFLVRDKKKVDLQYLKSYNPKLGIDLINCDLRELDINNKIDILKSASFDLGTIWPTSLPQSFNPLSILELNKNPGLNVKKIHNQGITGKGVGIAIIDQPLLTTHQEIKNNLKYYNEINEEIDNSMDHISSEHGTAVASIAAGENIGVAPQADLYFIAVSNTVLVNGEMEIDHNNEAKAINEIFKINKSLTNKIRVISISNGWWKGQRGYEEIVQAIQNAKRENILVVSSSMIDYSGVFFDGLGKDPMGNPDDIKSYSSSFMYKDDYLNEKNINAFFEKRVLDKFKIKRSIKEILYVPMDSRTVASPASNDNYNYFSRGGWSFCSPYIAGMYALSCQVNPKITPEKFLKEALETGDSIEVKEGNSSYYLNKIINPIKLLEKVKK